ncbi:helix-turn-helix transcriptional regulator [Phytoactinopolyspora endophytica]|uniref:helix-turn-helix transcriptional regulator n=1 Tax=Phytoactinopolyspora endophytica TaxID=1642495 RepID=UPI00101DC59A|nr:AraC family transcriptional regulator [Phytoactinopolyspora endophytica]
MTVDTYADYFDFTVTDIDYVIQRDPNPSWGITALVNDHSHILVYAASGIAHYNFEGHERLAVQPGDVLFFPKGTPHTGRADEDEPWSFLSVAFDVTADATGTQKQLSSLHNVYRGAPAKQLSAQFTELYVAWSDKKPGYLIRCRAITMAILYELIRQQTLPHVYTPHAQKIIRLIEMMQANYRESYSVTHLAELAGLSHSHFRSIFKDLTGLTAKEYQHRIKITKAKEFLLSGECNVTQAATRTGFNDIYYFSRLFKKVEGRNPSDFTKR